jgi:hypothetical protein
VMPSGRFAVTRDNAKSIRSMRVMFITPSYTPAGVRGSPAAMTTLPRVAPRGCAPPRPRHRTSAPCCSIAPVGAVVIRTAAIPIPAIKVGIATIKSEATSISEAAAISEAASESAVKPESATAETTSVEAAAAETTSMTSAAKAAAAARECFVVRGHQSSDDKRGNERRRDFGSHNAFSVSLDGCGKNEELLPR